MSELRAQFRIVLLMLEHFARSVMGRLDVEFGCYLIVLWNHFRLFGMKFFRIQRAGNNTRRGYDVFGQCCPNCGELVCFADDGYAVKKGTVDRWMKSGFVYDK